MKPKISLLGITGLFLSTSFLINAQQNSAVAQITATPNDAGTVVNQNGNELKIEGGTEAGNNIFHSFDKFGVNKEQTANFISKPEIKNILGRVKGSGNDASASVINGLIQVTGGNSNLYLMNPAGIIFGQNASLNVPGAFTATTANGIGFGDKWFNAFGTNDYAELIANPDAFAFTQAGAILNEGNLAVKSGQNLTLLGGTVVSSNPLNAAAGNIAIVTVSGKKIVRITQPGNILSLETEPITESSSLPNTVKSLPELLTSEEVINATDAEVNGDEVELTGSGLRINGDEVELTGSGLKIEDGDLVVNSVFAKNATLSSSRNLISTARKLNTSGNLNLFAQDTINLLDSADKNFILQTGDNLQIKGNENINIQVDKNNTSLIQAGGNLDLISDGIITGNARFITGGNFSVKNLTGGVGNFNSDFLSNVGANRKRIISSNGDVNFGSYKGPSLKVEAKGDINVDGNITITQPNTSLVGTDPDIPILKNNSSLILRAGLSELKNPVSNSPTSVDETRFKNTDSSTSPGNITINGNITIKQSKDNEILGPTILSAKNNINVKGNMLLGEKGRSNSPLIVNSLEGNILITGNIEFAGSAILNSKQDINIEDISTLEAGDISSGPSTGSNINEFAFLTSENGKITVNTLRVFWGDIIINAADTFQAKGTVLTDFVGGNDGRTNFGKPPKNVPVSIQAGGRNGYINIQHGGVKFTHGIGVERDENENITYQVQSDTESERIEVDFKYSDDNSEILFVDKNNNTVDKTVTVYKDDDFNINETSPDQSFTNGLIVKKGGNNEGMYGVSGDTFLKGSSDINIDSVPKSQPPETPETPETLEPDTSNEDGEVVQRQLSKEEQSAACSPQKSNTAGNTTENTSGENATNNSRSTKDNPCRTIDNNNNILKVIEDNRTNSNSALPTFLFRQGKK